MSSVTIPKAVSGGNSPYETFERNPEIVRLKRSCATEKREPDSSNTLIRLYATIILFHLVRSKKR